MEQNISWCMKVMFVYLKDKIKEYLKMEQKWDDHEMVKVILRSLVFRNPTQV
jgi:hypothetical protein